MSQFLILSADFNGLTAKFDILTANFTNLTADIIFQKKLPGSNPDSTR